MRIAVCPGSFNPITLGHMDIIRRSSKLFDHVIVAVLQNSAKNCDFTVRERVEMIEDSIKGIKNVSAAAFDGMLADYARQVGATAIVKGLRAVSDFEYEFQMALVNQELSPQIDTIFLTTSHEYMFLSSSMVREIARNKGDIGRFVPECVAQRVKAKYLKGVQL